MDLPVCMLGPNPTPAPLLPPATAGRVMCDSGGSPVKAVCGPTGRPSTLQSPTRDTPLQSGGTCKVQTQNFSGAEKSGTTGVWTLARCCLPPCVPPSFPGKCYRPMILAAPWWWCSLTHTSQARTCALLQRPPDDPCSAQQTHSAEQSAHTGEREGRWRSREYILL